MAGGRLLPAAPEHVGVAALETDYPLAAAGQVDQECVDLLLTHDVSAATLGGVDDLRAGVKVLQEVPGRQRVDDDHVRPAQQLQAAGGDEAAAARAAAHQGHPAIRGTRGVSGTVGSMGRDVVGHASAPA